MKNKKLVPMSSTHPLGRLKLLSLLAIVLLYGCSDSSTAATEAEGYTFSNPSSGGIGKFYMGREISHVMGHQGAAWLDRRTRERQERTDLLVENLQLQPGNNVADIGAGSGYFSLRMARQVGPTGLVYAVDIQPEMLAIVESKSAEAGLENIQRVLASEDNPNLNPESVDLALFVDAYHEFKWPREVMSAIHTALVPGGKVVLIEYREEDPSVAIKPLHKMSEKQVRKELESAGFAFVKNGEFLPQQHFLLFEKIVN
jgi:ubiquinone/menaquinone biosynthesis C-methylase UbiE